MCWGCWCPLQPSDVPVDGRSGGAVGLPVLAEQPVETAADEQSASLQLERSQHGHCCSNSQQPSPWQRMLPQRLPRQLCSRGVEGEGVRKSGLRRRAPPKPQACRSECVSQSKRLLDWCTGVLVDWCTGAPFLSEQTAAWLCELATTDNLKSFQSSLSEQ